MNVHLIESFAEAEAFMSWLGERRPILAIDTETGGLNWWRDELRLVQFGDTEDGWAIPFNRWGGLAFEAILRYADPIAFHNAPFDVRYLEINGGTFNERATINDTRILDALVEPERSHALKRVASRRIGADCDDYEAALARAFTLGGWTWATVPVTLPEYWEYACVDTILTARLYEDLRPLVTDRLNELYEMELEIQKIVDRIERRGMRIDKEYCAVKRVELTAWYEDAEAWCRDKYGFNPGQDAEVAAQLQKDGIMLEKRTQGGAWSVDKTVLEDLDHPLAGVVLAVRKAKRTANAYFGNYVDLAEGLAEGDILHASINTIGARTGRMSISRPALQQVPRSALLRDAFLPHQNNKLVSVDYDQLEMRLLTHFSGDPGLLAAFASDGDFFLNAASQIFGEEITDKKDPRRTPTKNASYANIYGAGDSKFARTAHCSVEAGIEFRAKYRATFPGVDTFIENVKTIAAKRGMEEGQPYVFTPLGRKEPCERDKLYAIINYLIQGTASDVFKQALIELNRYGLADQVVMLIHDEIIGDIPEADATAWGAAVAETMSKVGDQFIVPLTTSADVLDRWGQKYND